MCGRYTTCTEEEILEIKNIIKDISIKLSEEDKKYLGKEVSPTIMAPVIDNKKELKLIKWGFEKWDQKGVIFNARSDKLETSQFYLYNYKNGRCLIPLTNYYEWEKVGLKKEKYEIKPDKVLFMAGLIKKEKDGSDSYTIITKDANDDIKFIHPRMPIFVSNEKAENWLNGNLSIKELEKDFQVMNYHKSNQEVKN